MSEHNVEYEGLKYTEYICDLCKGNPREIFYTRSKLNEHMRVEHREKEKFIAEIGGRNGYKE